MLGSKVDNPCPLIFIKAQGCHTKTTKHEDHEHHNRNKEHTKHTFIRAVFFEAKLFVLLEFKRIKLSNRVKERLMVLYIMYDITNINQIKHVK